MCQSTQVTLQILDFVGVGRWVFLARVFVHIPDSDADTNE